MYYILKEDIKDLDSLINELKNRMLKRNKYSCNKCNAFAVATWFASTEIREYLFLSERVCCSDPRISWITSRKQCTSEEEFLTKIDEKIKQQIENRNNYDFRN